ncbi:MAG: ATP-dependent Clp protease proteolytic subunit [Chloroflexota bacterium]|nr:ATP-dependent Clp protease proteolytic subunit [Chloroflexota bacterium]
MPTTYQEEVFKQRLFKREIWINGEINEELIERLVVNLLALDETEADRREPRPIKVYINSNGGNLREALVAVDVMLALNSPVETIVLGNALSAGLVLLMGGYTRKAYERSTLLFHTARKWVWGILPDVESGIQHTKYLVDMQADLFGSRTRWPKETWLELLEGGRDRWFTAREALEIGILTEIVPRSAREIRPAELLAPDAKPMLEEPKANLALEEPSTNGKVEVVPATAQVINNENATIKKKRKKS